MKRRWISLLLTMALLLTLLPRTAPAAAAEGTRGSSGTCGDNLTWTFDPDTGLLAIEGTGEMGDFWIYDENGADLAVPWGHLCEQITALSLPDGLETVSSGAFFDCSRLTEATIPANVYAVESASFARCTALERITFLNRSCSIDSECLSETWGVTIFGYRVSTASRFASAQNYCFVQLDDPILEGDCGDDLTWRFDLDTGLLSIEGEGDMWDFYESKGDGYYSATTTPWRNYSCLVTALSLSEGLTSIGAAAFTGFPRLSCAVIPAGVTRISPYAFGACHALTEVTLPDSLTEIGESAFSFCSALVSVTIPSGVTGIGYGAFAACSALQEVVLTEGIGWIGSEAFCDCEGLTEVTIPESVTSVGARAFSWCTGLTGITFLNGMCQIADDCLNDAGDVTVFGYAGSTAELFAESLGFYFVALDVFTPEGVCGETLTWRFDAAAGLLTIEGSGAMYEYDSCYAVPWYPLCARIKSVSLPDGLTSISAQAFLRCTQLTEAAIPDGVTSIGREAFFGCGRLTQITLPDSVSRIGPGAFSHCGALNAVELPGSVTEIADSLFYDCSSLTSVAIPEGVTGIGSEAFSCCSSLSSAAIPDSVTDIGEAAFYRCTGLTSVRLPSGLVALSARVFDNCRNLTSITLPESLCSIRDRALYGCLALTELTVPERVIEVGSEAFAVCISLGSVTFLNGNTDISYDCLPDLDGVTIRGYSFSTAERFAAELGYRFVSIGLFSPEGMCGPDLAWRFEPETGLLVIEGSGFMWDVTGGDAWSFFSDRITAVSLPEGLDNIGDHAFADCTGLTAIGIPDSVKEIGLCAFLRCAGLTELQLPPELTSIEEAAFAGCTGLTAVELPASVRYLGVGAFAACTALTALTILHPACQIGSNCLADVRTATVFGYAGSTAAWLADEAELPFVSFGSYTAEGVCGDELTWSFDSETGILAVEGSGPMWDFLKYDEGCKAESREIPWADVCPLIEQVRLPDGLTGIGDRAFQSCTRLCRISLPAGLTRIGDYAFSDCARLNALALPDSVSFLGDYAFSCAGLTALTLPAGITAIQSGTFLGCAALTAVTIPGSVTSIGDFAFSDCGALTAVTIPACVTHIETCAFSGCAGLTELRVEDGNPIYRSIGGVLFTRDGSALLAYPAGRSGAYTVPEGVASIEPFAFERCEGLTDVNLPDSLLLIGDHAFDSCSALRFATVPAGVTAVGRCAFGSCSDLYAAAFLGPQCEISDYCLPDADEYNVNVYGCSGSTAEVYADRFGYSFCRIGTVDCPEMCGDYLYWSFDPESGALAFIGSGEMWDFEDPDAPNDHQYWSAQPLPWLPFRKQITSVSLPDGLTELGDNAFRSCSSLTGIELPETLCFIGNGTFRDCAGLTGIELPKDLYGISSFTFFGCTGLRSFEIPAAVSWIGEQAFSHCTSMTELEIPAAVSWIGEQAFTYCTSLTELGVAPGNEFFTVDPYGALYSIDRTSLICLPAGKSGSYTVPTYVTVIEAGAFAGCAGLTDVRLPDSLVLVWRDAFADCTALTEVTVPDSVSMLDSGVFRNCSGLQTVTLPKRLRAVPDETFFGCTALREIAIPGSVSEIGSRAFSGCAALTEVTVPSSVKLLGWEAFSCCTGLLAAMILYPDCDILPDCFRGCDALTLYGYSGSTAESFAAWNDLPFVSLGPTALSGPCGDSLTWRFDRDSGVLTLEGSGRMWEFDDSEAPWSQYRDEILRVFFPDGLESIGANAFNECDLLNDVVLPEGLTKIGEYSFSGCNNLATLTLPDSVLSIDRYAFCDCVELTAVTLPASLTFIGEASFRRCRELAELTVPGGVISVGEDAFAECEGLQTVTVSEGVISIEHNAFRNCSELHTVSLPNSLRYLSGFSGCCSLTEVTVPPSVRSIEQEAFLDCGSLRAVRIPGRVTEIGDRAFSGCSGLSELVLSEGVTGIGFETFKGCLALRELVLPHSLTQLGADAFSGCTGLVLAIFRNPDCMTVSEIVYESFETDEDLYDPGEGGWEALETSEYHMNLGLPDQTVVYGPHDPEKENAEALTAIDQAGEEEANRKVSILRCLENYLKTCGYFFCATNVFSDVKEGRFYEIPVAWAYAKGVTSGVDETHFGPSQTCTRAQVVTFLWNAMGQPDPTITEHPFTDVKEGKFYYNAMLWAYETGVTSGVDETHFGPSQTCTRGQVVTFLWNAMGQPAPTITEHPFVDVKPGKFYYNAMLWAYENGVTSGVDATHFGPSQTCTRGQVVTFLYNTLTQ